MKYIKKISLLVMITICTICISACGKKNKNNDSGEQSTYEITTTQSDVKAENGKDASTGDLPESGTSYTEENGTLYVKNVSLNIPKGYSFFSDERNTLVYSTQEGSSFALYVDNNNPYSKEEIETSYEEQIKRTYGDHVVSAAEKINGKTYKVFDIDAPDNSYVGEAAILVDGTTLIYFEFINLSKNESDFKTIIETIQYTK